MPLLQQQSVNGRACGALNASGRALPWACTMHAPRCAVELCIKFIDYGSLPDENYASEPHGGSNSFKDL
jgi:hypothetical protein